MSSDLVLSLTAPESVKAFTLELPRISFHFHLDGETVTVKATLGHMEVVGDEKRAVRFSLSKIFADQPPVQMVLTEQLKASLDRPVCTLAMSARALNVICNHGIDWLGELVQHTPKEILNMKNCGKLTLREIETHLTALGLSLNMRLDGWAPPTTLTSGQRAVLDRPIKSLALSRDIVRQLESSGNIFVGNLVRFDRYLSLEIPCGRVQVARCLREQGVCPYDWFPSRDAGSKDKIAQWVQPQLA